VLQQVKPWPYQLPERGANTLVAGTAAGNDESSIKSNDSIAESERNRTGERKSVPSRI
jgi:hypothetical protein